MGLKYVKKQAQARWPKGWKKGDVHVIPPVGVDPAEVRPAVVKDLMPFLYVYSDYVTSTYDFAMKMISDINRFFIDNPHAITFVIRRDFSSLVTTMKAETAAKRKASFSSGKYMKHEMDAKGKWVPTGEHLPNAKYPDGCILTNEGVVHTEDGMVEPIYIKRVMSTGYLVPQLFAYIRRTILLFSGWADSTHIVAEFDLDTENPTFTRPQVFMKVPGTDAFNWYYFEDLAPKADRLPAATMEEEDAKEFLSRCDMKDARSRLLVRRAYRNSMGEADLGVIWWMKVILAAYPNAHVVLHTKDSDSITMLVHEFWDNTPAISWWHWPGEYLDVQTFIKDIKETRDISMKAEVRSKIVHPPTPTKFTWKTFVWWCIINGTDFFDKTLCTDHVGEDYLGDAAMRVDNELTAPIESLKGFCEGIRMVWGQAKAWPTSPEALANKKKDGKIGIPTYAWLQSKYPAKNAIQPPKSDRDLEVAYSRFRPNFVYWAYLDTKRDPEPYVPSPEGQAIFDAANNRKKSLGAAAAAKRKIAAEKKAAKDLENGVEAKVKEPAKRVTLPLGKIPKALLEVRSKVQKMIKEGKKAEAASEMKDHLLDNGYCLDSHRAVCELALCITTPVRLNMTVMDRILSTIDEFRADPQQSEFERVDDDVGDGSASDGGLAAAMVEVGMDDD